MASFSNILSGGDLRSIGKSNSIVSKVKNQHDFDELFKYLYHKDRVVVMRAADVIEKITTNNKSYLSCHKKEILEHCQREDDKELKWHLALLLPRLDLDNKELGKAWTLLITWSIDKTNSRIVRVNSIHGFFEMVKQERKLEKDFNRTLDELEKKNVPSINARIRKLRKARR